MNADRRTNNKLPYPSVRRYILARAVQPCVLVIGKSKKPPDNKPKPSTAASVKTRAWKSVARKISDA